MLKTKLNYCDRSSGVRSMMKTTQDNNVIDCIGTVYMQQTKLNYHDWLDWVQSMMKITQDNNVINRTGVVYSENDIEQS